MYLNIDTEYNLMRCAEIGEHHEATNHELEECPTNGFDEDAYDPEK